MNGVYLENRDAEALAAERARFFRAAFANALSAGLESSSNELARKAFVDRLEAEMRRRLAKHLAPVDSTVAVLTLTKV